MRQDAYDLTILLIDTGARYSEIAQIEWKAIDLAKGEIHLYRSKVKNESVLALTKRSAAILARRRDEMRNDRRFVFEREGGGARNYCPRAFNSACKRARIDGITLHSLRHMWASRAAQNGLSLGEIQQQLGHSTIQMSMRYSHLMPNQASRKAADIMNTLYE
ncbi:site-specific integrase [Roseateles sp. 22389]|uniref:site-specific integrase n=1 Tax=Roseateles sp. 22389 TaxID=3453916 RepID=UPI003F84E7C5